MRLFLDLETYSETPIKNGTHRYAADSEVLLTALAIDHGPVTVHEGLPEMLQELIDYCDEVVIHNSAFDRTVLAAHGVTVPVEKIVDTMVIAYQHSLPGALGKLCDVLKVPTNSVKDKEGRRFINLFCRPYGERRCDASTHPQDWKRFRDYAGSDILAMREVLKRLPRFNDERELWVLDQRINDRGYPVDVEFARAASATVDQERKRMAARTAEMTDGDVESLTQRDKLLAHVLGHYGIELPDMRKSTLERRINDENLPDPVRELLAMRLDAAATSVDKYNSLLRVTSADGRLRGSLQFCGASRTGRWSGRLFQPQNLPRPKHSREQIAETVRAVKCGAADLLFDDVMRRCISAVRAAIAAPPGHKLVAADLSNIEGRVLAWLAGEEWKLKAFRDFDAGEGHDLYKLAFARSFRVDPDTVTKEQRQLGKVMELALGYQGGSGAFGSMAALYGIELPPSRVAELVRVWREANPAIVNFWWSLDRAVRDAISHPGRVYRVGRLAVRRNGAWLRIALPSGRYLCYPQPAIEEDEISYAGTNAYSRNWSRLRTYGGKLAENVTQAVARDVLAAGMLAAERAGYPIVLTVHDEIIAETPDDPQFSGDHLAAIMCTPGVDWVDGLPLAAEGEDMMFYGK